MSCAGMAFVQSHWLKSGDFEVRQCDGSGLDKNGFKTLYRGLDVNTLEMAVGRWPGILQALGIQEYFLRNKHGPCPICKDGKDRYRFDDKDGRGTWFCNHCGAGTGIDLVMRVDGIEFAEAAKRVDSVLGNVTQNAPKAARKDPAILLRKIYAGLQPAAGDTPVAAYLSSRGLHVPETGIWYCPEMAYYDDGKLQGKHPAMVAMYRSAAFKPITYHVTYLTPEGTKAPVANVRKIMPPVEPMQGGSIALSKPGATMGIAEGIETALSASLRSKIPVWASANAGMLEQWDPPAGARNIVVFGDNDESYTGQAAAYRLAHRLAIKGFSVVVQIPDEVGDWNDFLMRQKP
jgi:putative DNA primase/helicase